MTIQVPLSDYVVVNDLVFTSGVLGFDAATGQRPQSFREEFAALATSLTSRLETAGSSISRVVRAQCILRSFDDFDEFNLLYAELFPARPARTTFAAQLFRDHRVEIDVVATLGGPR